MIRVTIAVMSVLLGGCGTGRTAHASGPFDYLDVRGRTIETTHSLPVRTALPRDFALLGEKAHEPVFDGSKFNVSLVAFARRDEFVMIHAERHSDGSAGLDYSHHSPSTLNGQPVHSQVQCAQLSSDDVSEEHDLRFLRENGFDPSPAIYIRQFFITSADGTSEVVLTWGRRMGKCAEADIPLLGREAETVFASVVISR